ncbi:MAG: hypothetical protein JZU64_02050 [Rhodoferax sp.]|nr:hypothetical protein [Rhodoferax sp.]
MLENLLSFSRMRESRTAWIPAFAGMTGVTVYHAGHVSAAHAKVKAELEYANYRKQQDLLPCAVDADFERVANELKALPPLKRVTRKGSGK